MRAIFVLLLLCLGGPGALFAGGVRYDLVLSSRVDYYSDEDLFGGKYAPFYQTLQLSVENLYGGKARFYSYLFATKDLASDADFDSRIYSTFLEVENASAFSKVRVGRFVHTGGIGFKLLDGGDVYFKPVHGFGVELYAGKNKIFYDTRFTDMPFRKAPFTDRGFIYGGNLGYKAAKKTLFQVGFSAFDSEQEARTERYITCQFSRALPKRFQLDLSGYEDITSDSGSEFLGKLAWEDEGGAKAYFSYDRLRPDRVNPEVITSIFVADEVSILASGASVPITDSVSLFGDYENYWFDTPGGEDPSRSNPSVIAGVAANFWTAKGLTAKGSFRIMTGDAGKLHQVSFSGEKRISSFLSGGWAFDWLRYRREEEGWENAYVLSGLLKLFFRTDLWLLFELEDYHNIDFDYNVRMKVSLNYRFRHGS